MLEDKHDDQLCLMKMSNL